MIVGFQVLLIGLLADVISATASCSRISSTACARSNCLAEARRRHRERPPRALHGRRARPAVGRTSGRSVGRLRRHPRLQRRRGDRRRRVARSLPPGRGARSSSSTTGRTTTPARGRAAAGRDGRAASLQQGQRRGGEERHPQRDRRVRPDRRRRRPASARGRAPLVARLGEYDLVVGARSRDDAGDARAPLRQRRAERLASYLTGRDIPDLTSGFRGARARAPARVPPPAAERLLDADDDDAGVHQGGLQRRVRADRGAAARRAVEDPARARRREVPDDHPEDRDDLQPAARLPADQPRSRSCSASATASGTSIVHAAHSERLGAADPVRGRRVPRRPRLRADFGAALRRPPVVIAADRPAGVRSRRPRSPASCCGSRSALGYWVDKPLTHDEREYLALAGSLAAGAGSPTTAEHESRDRAAVRPRARLPALPRRDRRRRSRTTSNAPARVKIAQSVARRTARLADRRARGAGGRTGAPAIVAAAIAACIRRSSGSRRTCSAKRSTRAGAAGALLLQIAVTRSRRAHSPREARTAGARLAGALVGVAILIRPAMLFFLPLARSGWFERSAACLRSRFVAAAVAVIAPWTVRNHRVYGRFVLVASEGGSRSGPATIRSRAAKAISRPIPTSSAPSSRSGAAHPGLTAEELEPLYYRDALRYIAANPGVVAGPAREESVLYGRARRPVVCATLDDVTGSRRSRRTCCCCRSRSRLRRAAARRGDRRSRSCLLAASSVLVGLVFFPQERFRIPVIDPALIVAQPPA